MARRKRKRSKSYFTVKEGVFTRRPASPGKPERNLGQVIASGEKEVSEESFETRDNDACGRKEE